MIPEGWRQEVADMVFTKITKGTTPPKGDLVIKGGVPFLRVNNLGSDGGRKIQGGIIFVSGECHVNVLGRSRCFPGDILINIVGPPLGKSIFLNADFPFYNINQAIVLFRADENIINRDYAYYFINGDFAKNWLESHAKKTSGQQNLTIETCKSLPISLPPAAEQRRIAEILATWDRAIETVDELVANARAQKMALMQSLLTGKHRLPGFSEEWRWAKFSEVFERVRQKNVVGNTNVLTISAQHGLISQVEYFNKSVASEDVRGYTLLRRGDFAYNKSYSDGYPMGAFKPLERYDSGIVSSLYICFRLADEGNDHGFFRHYFEAGLFNREIAAIAQEGARNHGLLNVSVVDFFDTSLHAPCHDEQVAIATVINAAEQAEQALRNQRTALRREKSALMQQLLTGKRRVKITEREHA